MISWSATTIAEEVRAGRVKASTVLDAFLSRIHDIEPTLHSFITVAEDSARVRATEIDAMIAAGDDPGPFAGVPFSVKDTYDTAGVRTTYGSRIYADHVPESTFVPVQRLLDAGGVLIGKTNTPEFAVFIRTVNDLIPECPNAWDHERTSGGSSGGAAASVAAGLTPVAVGSDGGGSVRIPAALNGVFGLMPSRGTLPRAGGGITTRNFSTAGPLARCAEDLQLMLDIMSGPAEYDPISKGVCPPLRSSEREQISGLRWIEANGMFQCDPDVRDLVKHAARTLAADAGLTFHDDGRSLPSAEFTDPFYSIMKADRLAGGGEKLLSDTHVDRLTDYARHQFEDARNVTGADYSLALEDQFRATAQLETLLSEDCVVATPTVQSIAPHIPEGERALPEEARASFVANTFLMNYCGFPALTVPCGQVAGMPVGLHLVGLPGEEAHLIALAARVCDEAPLAEAAISIEPGSDIKDSPTRSVSGGQS